MSGGWAKGRKLLGGGWGMTCPWLLVAGLRRMHRCQHSGSNARTAAVPLRFSAPQAVPDADHWPGLHAPVRHSTAQHGTAWHCMVRPRITSRKALLRQCRPLCRHNAACMLLLRLPALQPSKPCPTRAPLLTPTWSRRVWPAETSSCSHSCAGGVERLTGMPSCYNPVPLQAGRGQPRRQAGELADRHHDCSAPAAQNLRPVLLQGKLAGDKLVRAWSFMPAMNGANAALAWRRAWRRCCPCMVGQAPLG